MASSDASPDRPQANAQQQTVRAFLSGLFGQLCAGQGSFSQTGLLQQPWVLATAARLIGDYAMWFSRLGGPEAPLEGALRLLLQAMLLSQVRLSQLRLSLTNGEHKSCLFGLTAPNTHLCWHALHVWGCSTQNSMSDSSDVSQTQSLPCTLFCHPSSRHSATVPGRHSNLSLESTTAECMRDSPCVTA